MSTHKLRMQIYRYITPWDYSLSYEHFPLSGKLKLELNVQTREMKGISCFLNFDKDLSSYYVYMQNHFYLNAPV